MSNEQLDRLRNIRINTVVKLYTLVLLAEEERHGYELMKLLGDMLGAPIGPSQVYPFLKKLERAGLLISRKSGSREKKVYSLTPQGYEFVKETLEKSLSVLHTAVKILGKDKVCLP